MTTPSRAPIPATRVAHVRQALLREFGDLIDLSDVETQRTDEIEKQRLSRSLAALAVRRLTGCDSSAAARSVVDGRNDQGIDAVAFGDSAPELFLVQAKWNERGTAGVDTAAAHKMIDGFRKIEARYFDRFNDRFHAVAEKVKTVLADYHVRVTLVLAVMGSGELSTEVRGVFDDACDEFNGSGPMLGYRVLDGAEFVRQIQDDMVGPDISLSVRMRQWLRREQPTDAYQGSVAADEVAEWFSEHGDRLYDRNLRRSLGLTAVNQGMVATLKNDPVSFWSRNNGITILCSDIKPRYFGSRKSSNEPVELALRGASVVNGAQTVTAIHVANEESPEQVRDADVSVRVICVPDGVDEFEITRSTNTQNHMESRDFIALEPEQVRIREDFALSLDKIYVFKRGDLDPAPEAGCSVVHAAFALACAHRNPEFAVRAKRDPNLLWEKGTRGAYPALFGNEPPALHIWRSVLLFRAISSALHNQARKLEGRASAIAEDGDLITAHVVFQLVGPEKIEDPDCDWDNELGQVGDLVRLALLWLVDQVDRQFGSNSFVKSTFANPDRCRKLVASVIKHIANGEPVPEVSDEYRSVASVRKPRARNAVPVLVDAGRIEQGATLHYVPETARERQAMEQWLSADRRRGLATWVPERGKPLLWAADGRQYSPSGLVQHIWEQAGWDNAPVAIQGPKCWHLGDEGSLADLAAKLRRAEESE